MRVAILFLLLLSGCVSPTTIKGPSLSQRVSITADEGIDISKWEAYLDVCESYYVGWQGGSLVDVRQVVVVKGETPQGEMGYASGRTIWVSESYPWAVLHEFHHVRRQHWGHDTSYWQANRIGERLAKTYFGKEKF